MDADEALIVTLNGDGWGCGYGLGKDRFTHFSWSGARRFDIEGFGNIGVAMRGDGYGGGYQFHTDLAKRWWGHGVPVENRRET